MQLQNPKKNHHILPQLYLRGFAVSREKPFVYVYEKGERKEPKVPTPISKAAAIPYAYGYTKRDGTFDPDTFENELEKLEKPADPIFRKILSREMLDKDEKKIFTSYVLLMRRRVPKREARSREYWSEVLIDSAEDFKILRSPEFRARFSDDKQKEIDDMLAYYESGPPREILLRSMINEPEDSPRYLRSMKWRFLIASGPSRFLTGDDPVGDTSFGLIKLPAEITFPISSEITLHASWQEGPEGFLHVSEEYVRQLNHRTASRSDQLFYHRAERWVAQILNKRNHPSYLLDVTGTLPLLWKHRHLDIPVQWLESA